MTKLLIVDDEQIEREGLQMILQKAYPNLVIEQSKNGKLAVEMAGTSKPDLILMDIKMPGMSGIETTRQIVASQPQVRVLMLTMFDDDESVFAAMRAGARGYVLKGAVPDNVIRAIAAVAAGEAIFGPGVARRALTYLSRPRTDPLAFPELTPREREVLALIADGRGNAAIAAQLGLAAATVGNHITNVFAKLQVASRAEAMVRARSAGLGG